MLKRFQGIIWLAVGFVLIFGIYWLMDLFPVFQDQPFIKDLVAFVLFLIVACSFIFVFARKREQELASAAIREQQEANQRAENRNKRLAGKKKKKR